MLRFDGSLARSLDFDATGTNIRVPRTVNRTFAPTCERFGLLQGPDKYKVLEHRRRAAQIKARHALDLVELRNGDR
jgi:hypothetical protein